MLIYILRNGGKEITLESIDLILKLDSIAPLSAAGYFPVRRETFTALVGGAVSYVILLNQLKWSQ